METVLNYKQCGFSREDTNWFLQKSRKLSPLVGREARVHWTIDHSNNGYRVLCNAFAKNLDVHSRALGSDVKSTFRHALLKVWSQIVKRSHRAADLRRRP